jgi:hypothetical protein
LPALTTVLGHTPLPSVRRSRQVLASGDSGQRIQTTSIRRLLCGADWHRHRAQLGVDLQSLGHGTAHGVAADVHGVACLGLAACAGRIRRCAAGSLDAGWPGEHRARALTAVLVVRLEVLLHVVGAREFLLAAWVRAFDRFLGGVDLRVARSVAGCCEGLLAVVRVSVAAWVPLRFGLGAATVMVGRVGAGLYHGSLTEILG